MPRKKGPPKGGRPNPSQPKGPVAQTQSQAQGRPYGGGPKSRRGGLDQWSQGPASSANASSVSLPRTAAAQGNTLAEVARNTAHKRRGFLGQDGRLRHQPIIFVSSGFMDPLKDLEVEQMKGPQEDDNQIPREHTIVQHQIVPDLDGAGVGAEESSLEEADAEEAAVEDATGQDVTYLMSEVDAPEDVRTPSPSKMFVVDTSGDRSLHPDKLPTILVSDDKDSADDTDSSEEVILFKGRDTTRQGASSRSSVNKNKRSKLGSDPMNSASSRPDDRGDSMQLRQLDVEIKIVERTLQSDAKSDSENVPRPETPDITLDDASLADMDLTQTFDPLEKLLNSTHSDEEAAMIADYIANMDNEDDEEASSEDHPGLGSHAFHMLRDLGGTDSDAIPDEITEDDSSDDKPDEGDDSEDQRRRIALSDERLAQILAKQAELGLGTDEVLLYDDADVEDGQGEWQIAPKSSPRRKKKGSSKKDKIIQQKGQFPSATQMANALDELDLMDWHRPALNNFKRASRGVPQVSDSELEEALNMAFQKDRVKKAEKKKQREELRARGLLGKNVDPDDLRVKYPAGMRSDDLAYELEQFLLGDDEQLILPPIDKTARRLVHLAAMKLGIKTQSAGKGNSRYPVLYRSKKTVQYEERIFTAATRQLLKQTYFPRVDVDVDPEFIRSQKVAQRKQPQERGRNAISYREGEIVGQHASELGSANKGRLLLEKMGWSKGMSLGSGENKGIMVPIVHVVKKTKAGLGDI